MIKRAITGMVFWALVVCHAVGLLGADTSQAPGNQETPAATGTVRWAIGGVGGAYLLASPGELVIDVYKRDLHRHRRTTELRALLAGPDRRVLQEVRIPDDGQSSGGPGPVQQARLSAQVDRKGVYLLNITVSQDRYGEEIAWGFRTNCPHYVIETARGHRDEAHQEPIVLVNPDLAGDVCFLPRRDAFDIEITGLPKSVSSIGVFDGEDRPVAQMAVDSQGRAAHTFPAGVRRDAVPWRIHFPAQQAVVNIDGVTRWQPHDAYRDLTCWTPDRRSWFSWLPNRWLLTPYRRTAYGKPGQPGTIVFQVHNNAGEIRKVDLSIEFPGESWPVSINAPSTLEVGANATVPVEVSYRVPASGEKRVCHLRATVQDDRDFSTYSTLTVVAGQAPPNGPLTMPLVLKPYEHENEQFGYLPQYPVESQFYFDPENRPLTARGSGIVAWNEDHWEEHLLSRAVQRREPEFPGGGFSLVSSKVAFDRDGDLYLLARAGGKAALLHSADGGKSFVAYELPGVHRGGQSFDVEQFSGHNVPDGPPPILRYTFTAADPKLFWRRIHNLELIVAEKRDGQIVFAPPILVSNNCIGLAAHSGIPSSVVSRGDRVHVTWAEATDPAEKAPGVPTYVATYDRTAKTLGNPALVGHGPPANDIHNSPSITIDSQGFLHVLAGTHGAPFPYARSLAPNDSTKGWTEPTVVGEGLRQTYIGMVCGPDDTLHIAYRLWRSGAEPHPNSTYATLAYQRKPFDAPWEEPQILIVPPFSEYSVFYHRLTIDRRGRLFLSYDYWSTFWFYRNDHRGSRRALLTSPDGGRTWKLANQSDLALEPR